ncbi:MAG: tetraacyldisaccharide 4'-kinase [Syntrophobacteria bacterium]
MIRGRIEQIEEGCTEHRRSEPTPCYRVRHSGLLEKTFKLIVSEERRSAGLTVLRLLASWCAVVYGGVVELRNRLFDLNLLTSHRSDCRVISVGNLAVGGTGKTPMVLWLAQFLMDEGWRVAIVSRGYRGQAGRKVCILSDGQSILAGPEETGDEPQLLARRLPEVPVLCCARRVSAVRAAVKLFRCQVAILDDGFQHRFLARDLDVVLLDSRSPLGNGRLFPRGVLRERVGSLARAQILVLSRFDGSRRAQENRRALSRKWPGKPIFTARHRPLRLFEASTGREQPASVLAKLRLAAFAGIGQPEDFFRALDDLGGRLVYASALPDHHALTSELLGRLVREASRYKPQLWVTTEKDWIRLPETIPEDMDLWVLVVELELDLGNGESAFKQLVRGSVSPETGC